MKKYLLLLLPLLALGGCLQDNIDAPQIVPRPIFPPGGVYYTSITGTLNLQIRWNPPQVDTQQNFKGYFIKLYKSTPFIPVSSDGIDSFFEPGIDSAHVLKIDTSYTFLGKVMQGGRYTVRIWGERFPDPKKPDSLVLSFSPAELSFNFDPQPVSAPDSVFASSGGTSTVNLFWRRSTSENHIGFAGYVIRYKDPDNNAAKLTFAGVQQIDSFASQLTNNAYYKFSVNVTGNPQPPVEKEYTFWIKAIRKDSIESSDSVSITWSGAERLPGLAVKLDTGVFIGITGFQYGIAQLPIGPNSNPQFKISHVNGNIVVSQVDNATVFATRVDRDMNMNFETNFFGKAYLDADFSQTQISFPAQGGDNGAMIYVKFPPPGNNRARILFSKIPDTTHVNTGSYVRQDSTVLIQASFQPIAHPQLPFF